MQLFKMLSICYSPDTEGAGSAPDPTVDMALEPTLDAGVSEGTDVPETKPDLKPQIEHPKASDMKPWETKYKDKDQLRNAMMACSGDIFESAEGLVHHQGSKLAMLAADYWAMEYKIGQNEKPDFKAARRFTRKAVLDGIKIGEQTDNDVKMSSVEAALLTAVMGGWLLRTGKAVIAYAPPRARPGQVVSLDFVARKYPVPRICMPFNAVMPYVQTTNRITGKTSEVANNDSYLTPLNERYITAQFRHHAEGAKLTTLGTLKRADAVGAGQGSGTTTPAKATETTVNVANAKDVVQHAYGALQMMAVKGQLPPLEHITDTLDGIRMVLEKADLRSADEQEKKSLYEFADFITNILDRIEDIEAVNARQA